MKNVMTLIVAGLFVCLCCTAQAETQWYKGVTHVHSLWSDGDAAPDLITKWYVDHGYQFVCLSEHNTLQEGERFEPIGETMRLKPAHVEALRAALGEDWVEIREAGGHSGMRLKTHEELSARFNKPGEFLLVPAEEITTIGASPHVNGVNVRERIAGKQPGEVAARIQEYIDAVREQSERLGLPMIAHVNHVNWSDGVTAEELIQVKGLAYFEVFNGHPGVHNWGRESKGMPSTDRHWDIVQSMKLLEDPDQVLRAVATDDSHEYHEWGVGKVNPGRGWIMVRAEALEANALVEAIRAGEYYATTGVTLKNIAGTDSTLSVEIDAQSGVSYTTQFIGTLKGFDANSTAVSDAEGMPVETASRMYSDEIGQVLLQTTDLKPSYKFKGNELYVRAKIVSDKPQENPFKEGDVETAWVQPVLVSP